MIDKAFILKQLRCFRDGKARALALTATILLPPLLSPRPNVTQYHQVVTLAYGIGIGNV